MLGSPTIRSAAAALIIVLHLGGVFSDLLHEDFISVESRRAQETVTTHDCGPREVHKSIDAGHFCVPCYRIAAGVAGQNAEIVVVPPPATGISTGPTFFRSITELFPPTYHRGPPSFSSFL